MTELTLPWLSARLHLGVSEWEPHVRTALDKFATGDARRPVRVSIEMGAATDGSRSAAAALWHAPSIEYQFLRGHTDVDVSAFATADGSLARVRHADGVVDLRLQREVFNAPYSTWTDLFAAPLAEHWRATGHFPLHAAAVTRGPHTILIVGASGSGKTTTAMALLRNGGLWRADDKLLIAAADRSIDAISLYRNANVAPATSRAFRELAFVEGRPVTAAHDKRACLLVEVTDAVDLSTFTPTALLFPEQRATARSTVTRLSPTDALLRLAAQSPDSDVRARLTAQHRLLCRLATETPAFLLEAARDVLTTPEAVADRVTMAIAAEVPA